MKRFNIIFVLKAFLIAMLVLFSAATFATKTLTVGVWGGSYESAQRVALFEPFEAETNIIVQAQPYSGGLDVLRGKSIPDVLDMTEGDARLACEQGLLHQIDFIPLLPSSPAQLSPELDFIQGSIGPCSIAHLTYSSLLAYDVRAFTGEKPQQVADLFDLKKFPGKRALHKNPAEILEWALIAEGVPVGQVYDLLSTERGMNLAFKRLESIRDYIIWWDDPAEPVEMLQASHAVIAAGFNGRFFEAQNQGAPISMLWDGQIIARNVWALPRKSNEINDEAKHFIARVSDTRRMAALAEHIPYGPTRLSSFKRIGLHQSSGIPMRDQLPTAPHHLDNALFRDSLWYARTEVLRNRRFNAWLQEGD